MYSDIFRYRHFGWVLDSLDIRGWASPGCLGWSHGHGRHEVLSTSGIFTCPGPKLRFQSFGCHIPRTSGGMVDHVGRFLCNFHGANMMFRWLCQQYPYSFIHLFISLVLLKERFKLRVWQFSHLTSGGEAACFPENVTSGKRSRIAPLDTQKLDFDMFWTGNRPQKPIPAHTRKIQKVPWKSLDYSMSSISLTMPHSVGWSLPNTFAQESRFQASPPAIAEFKQSIFALANGCHLLQWTMFLQRSRVCPNYHEP